MCAVTRCGVLSSRLCGSIRRPAWLTWLVLAVPPVDLMRMTTLMNKNIYYATSNYDDTRHAPRAITFTLDHTTPQSSDTTCPLDMS